MAITYTSNKNFSIPSAGYNNWNVPIDLNWNGLDQLGGSSFPISIALGTTVDLTSSTAPVSSVNWWDAQQLTITATGTLTANATITLPANITGSGSMGGAWIVVNGITTNQSQTDISISAFPASGASTFTLGASAPVVGTIVVLSTNGVLPGGFSEGVEYYVQSRSGTTCSFSETYGGSAKTATSTSPYEGSNATLTAKYVLRVQKNGGAANSGVIIQPATKGYVYYNGTTVNFADDNILNSLSSVSGEFSINGPLSVNNKITTTDTVTFSATVTPDVKLTNIVENGTYSAPTWTATPDYNVLTQSVWYNTTAATSNFAINIRGNSNISLSSLLSSVGDLVTCVYIVNCGAASTSTFNATCAGTALTTTTSQSFSVGTAITITSTGVSLGTIVSGSGVNWVVSVGGTYSTSTGMTATVPIPYCSAVQIDGTATGVTTIWQSGVAPTSGTASSKNVYTFTVMKTATTPTYTVLANVASFA